LYNFGAGVAGCASKATEAIKADAPSSSFLILKKLFVYSE
jgi:hypothetical protein